MKRNEVLRPIPGQAWHHVPTFDDLVEGIYEAPPFKPKAYEYLRILNSPAIQQLVGNANLAASAAQREAYMGQREAVLQAVAHETGMDARTLKEVHERRIASGEIDGAGWYPPPFSKPRSEPVGEHDSPPVDIPPPPPKPRQPPGGGASARSPSRPIFEFGGSSGSGPGNGPFLGVGRRKSPLPVPEGVPAELGPRGPPPGPGPSGASQAAAVAAHNKVGEKGRETKEALDRVHELMREYHEKQTKIATAWLARGSTQTGITETLNRSVPIPAGLVHHPEDLEEDAMEIAAEQEAQASAFVEGVEPISSGEKRRRRKHPIQRGEAARLVEDVPQLPPAPMDVDTLAHAMIHQANSTKELSDKWMALSEHNNLLGLNYTRIIAKSLEEGHAMNTQQLRQLALLKDQEIRDAHKAGMQEREGYLNMMHAVFNKMNEQLTTTVGALSNQGGRISEMTQLLWEAHVRSQEAANKQRELEALIQSSNSRPGPGGGGGAIARGRATSRAVDMEVVAEIPETNPEADAAMDRAVQIAPARRSLSLDEMKDGLRGTVAKIRKITTPDVIPADVIPPEVPGGFEPLKSRLNAENRARPYPSTRPVTDRRDHSLPPVLPALAPAPPAPVLPTNGPHREANYTQLRDASQAREASAKPSTAVAGAVTAPRERAGRSRTPLRQDLVRPSQAPPRPSRAPARAPSEEVGRALSAAQSLHGSTASHRSASHRSASQHTEATSVSASHRSNSTVGRVAQRSSTLMRSHTRSRSPHGEAASSMTVPVLRPTRALSVASAASVGQEPSSRPASADDYARGQTPDKRFKAATGLPVRRSFLRTGRRARRTIYNEIANRD